MLVRAIVGSYWTLDARGCRKGFQLMEMGSGTPTAGVSNSSIHTSMLARLTANDPDSWRRCVQLYGPVIYGWARRAGLQDDDAADVAQEVLRTVSARIGDFRHDRPGDTFRGWLWTVTRSKVQDLRRRKQKQPVAWGGSEAQMQLNELPEVEDASSCNSDRHGLFRRALELIRAEFEDRTWQAFWRLTVDGHSADRVATDLQMSRGAVYVAKSRILARLRVEFSDLFNFDGLVK